MSRDLITCVKHSNLDLAHHRAFWEAVQKYLPAGALDNNGELGSIWNAAVPIKPAVQQPSTRLTPAADFSTRITPHIQLGEFALWQEARRFDHQHQVDTAAELAAFLERVRVQFGNKAIVITSGYRPPAINRSVGGASQSEHLFDAPSTGAVDFNVPGADITAVQTWCNKHWPYSLGYGAPKGFVHLGIRPGRPRVRWDY